MTFTLREVLQGKTHEGKRLDEDLCCHLFAQAFLPYVLNSIMDREEKYRIQYMSMKQIRILPSLDGIIFDTRGCAVRLAYGTKLSEIKKAFS